MPHIAVSYRDEGHGKGAFYDHLTLRNITGWQTKLVTSKALPTIKFGSYINLRQAEKRYGLPLNPTLPDECCNYAEEAAFIFLPGYTRASDKNQPESHIERIKFEQELIRKAKYRGQPVLAVCAGSWTLWQAYGGEIKAVKDHNYGGAMPRLSKSSAKICNNKMIHDVKTKVGSFIHHAMFAKSKHNQTAVNSVHWQAVDAKSISKTDNLCISAQSKKNVAIAPNSRQKKKMQPEHCVEAFETIHGVPMLGVQWHPEAFNPKDKNASPHHGIFEALKIAGKTYNNRRKLNREFKKNWLENAFSEHLFFKPKNNYAREDSTEEVEHKLAELAISKKESELTFSSLPSTSIPCGLPPAH